MVSIDDAWEQANNQPLTQEQVTRVGLIGREMLKTKVTVKEDRVKHPSHYTSDPSGVECITIVRHRNFNIGNAIKYLWRNGLKESAGQLPLEKQKEDLRKAIFLIEDEIARLDSLPVV